MVLANSKQKVVSRTRQVAKYVPKNVGLRQHKSTFYLSEKNENLGMRVQSVHILKICTLLIDFFYMYPLVLWWFRPCGKKVGSSCKQAFGASAQIILPISFQMVAKQCRAKARQRRQQQNM